MGQKKRNKGVCRVPPTSAPWHPPPWRHGTPPPPPFFRTPPKGGPQGACEGQPSPFGSALLESGGWFDGSMGGDRLERGKIYTNRNPNPFDGVIDRISFI